MLPWRSMINGSLGVFAWFRRKSWIYMGELRRPQRLRHRHSTEMCRAGENSSKEIWFFRWFPAHQEISSSCVSPPQFGQHFRGRFDLGWLLLILDDSHRSFQKYLPHWRRQFVPNADCPSACWSFNYWGIMICWSIPKSQEFCCPGDLDETRSCPIQT